MERELRMTRVLIDLCHEVTDAVKNKVDVIEEVKELGGRASGSDSMTYLMILRDEDMAKAKHIMELDQTDCKAILTKVRTTFKNAFNSEFKEHQLQKKLDKDEFQEDESMAAFWVVNNQFQKFIDSQFTLDNGSQMTNKYFIEYIGIEVKHFRDTLLQPMGNVKKFVAERTRHQRQYDRMVNKRQMQTQESKIDTGKAVNDDLVVTESNRTKSVVQDDNSRPGNDTTADNADIRPIYDEKPMAEEVNLHAKIQSHKTRNRKKPVDQKSHTQKPGRQIFTGHRFSPKKTSAVYERTYPRSDLRWKPTSRFFKSVGLRWIPTGKLFAFCTSKDDSEPTHGSNFNRENQVVSKPSAITTVDASDKRQQQPDSTSSTSTPATTITDDGNFDL
nr:hypothetical protein [Tanacetum cinerariifolium]